MPSSIRSDISRWSWWIINDVIKIIGKIIITDISWFDMDVTQGWDVYICLWFTRPVLLI
jgi:hypothetical protein